jgi:hypothetical protein
MADELNQTILTAVSVFSTHVDPLKSPSDIYPAVIAHGPRHASPSEPESTEMKGINPRLHNVYPRIPLCQSHNYIMPGITDSDSEALIDTAVYPEFELYHSVSVGEADCPTTAALLSLYPLMRICMSPRDS